MDKRPEFITKEDILRWDTNLAEDSNISELLLEDSTILEVCYAGLWLSEQLDQLLCPPEYIVRIQYSAGRASFGRDPWEVSQHFLENYKLNKLEFEPDFGAIN